MGCATSRPSSWAEQQHAEDTVVTRIEDSGTRTRLGEALTAAVGGTTVDADKLAGMQAALAALQASHAQLTQEMRSLKRENHKLQVQLSDPWTSLSLSSSSNLHPRASPTQAGAAALRAALGDAVAGDGVLTLPGTPAPARQHHGGAGALSLFGGAAQPLEAPPLLECQVGELAQRVSKVEAALLGLTAVKEALEAQRAALEFGRQLEKLEQVGIPTCKVAAGAATAAPCQPGKKAARQAGSSRASPPGGHGALPPPPPAEDLDPRWALLLPQPRYPPLKRSSATRDAPPTATAAAARGAAPLFHDADEERRSAPAVCSRGVGASQPQQSGPQHARHGAAAERRGAVASQGAPPHHKGMEGWHANLEHVGQQQPDQRGLITVGGREDHNEEEDESSHTCRFDRVDGRLEASPAAGLPGGAPAVTLLNVRQRFGPSATPGEQVAVLARAATAVRTAF